MSVGCDVLKCFSRMLSAVPGCFRPFNRLGIQHHSSPLLQMSFETSMKFLTEAIERGACGASNDWLH